jgi:hypothetical protein
LLSGSKASDRWFHGKIYEAIDARGRVSHRYIGSANFSPAAWGTPRNGGYVIINYEIGVLLRVKGGDPWITGDDTPGLDSHLLKDESDPVDQPEPTAPWSSWCWDGSQLTARVLVPKALHGQQVVVTVTDADGKEVTFERTLTSRSGDLQELHFPHPTAIAHISIAWPEGARESIVPIDLRPAEEVYEDLIDHEAKQDAGDAYLEAMLRRFGGGLDPDEDSHRRRQRRQPGSDMAGDGADYRQPWMEDARRVGLAIDGWQRAMHEAQGHSGYADEGQVAILRVDARRLIDYLIKRADGLRLSHPLRAAAWEVMAEELKLRSGDPGGRG